MSKATEDKATPSHWSDELERNFNAQLLNKHFDYVYENGWRYEFWVKNRTRIVYAIHGGPMAGRKNYQTAYYQQVRDDLWLASWVEETGTTVTIALDIANAKITTFMAFSHGHWTSPEQAHGYKKDQLEQWRELSKSGNQAQDRYVLPEQATINEIYEGRGELKDIQMDWPTTWETPPSRGRNARSLSFPASASTPSLSSSFSSLNIRDSSFSSPSTSLSFTPGSLKYDTSTEVCAVRDCLDTACGTAQCCKCRPCLAHLEGSASSTHSAPGCIACRRSSVDALCPPALQSTPGFSIQYFEDIKTPVHDVFATSDAVADGPTATTTTGTHVDFPDIAMPLGAESCPSPAARLSLARGSPRWHDPRGPASDPQEPYQLERGSWPVLKLENIPFVTSTRDIEEWLPPAVLPSEGKLPLAIHIILHRASGRTLPHCYIETFSLDMAYRIIVERDRSQFGGRTVRVKWERAGELMRDLFSQEDYYARSTAAPTRALLSPPVAVSTGHDINTRKSILPVTDIERLLHYCKIATDGSSNKSVERPAERAFLNIASLVLKFPFRFTDLYTSRDVNNLHRMLLCAIQFASLAYVHASSSPPVATTTTMTNKKSETYENALKKLVATALACDTFDEEQKMMFRTIGAELPFDVVVPVPIVKQTMATVADAQEGAGTGMGQK